MEKTVTTDNMTQSESNSTDDSDTSSDSEESQSGVSSDGDSSVSEEESIGPKQTQLVLKVTPSVPPPARKSDPPTNLQTASSSMAILVPLPLTKETTQSSRMTLNVSADDENGSGESSSGFSSTENSLPAKSHSIKQIINPPDSNLGSNSKTAFKGETTAKKGTASPVKNETGESDPYKKDEGQNEFEDRSGHSDDGDDDKIAMTADDILRQLGRLPPENSQIPPVSPISDIFQSPRSTTAAIVPKPLSKTRIPPKSSPSLKPMSPATSNDDTDRQLSPTTTVEEQNKDAECHPKSDLRPAASSINFQQKLEQKLAKTKPPPSSSSDTEDCNLKKLAPQPQAASGAGGDKDDSRINNCLGATDEIYQNVPLESASEISRPSSGWNDPVKGQDQKPFFGETPNSGNVKKAISSAAAGATITCAPLNVTQTPAVDHLTEKEIERLSSLVETYQKNLWSKLEKLRLDEICTKDWNFVENPARTDATIFINSSSKLYGHPRLQKEFGVVSTKLENIWRFLRFELIENFEKEFEKSICLFENEAETVFYKLRQPASNKIEKMGPEKIQKLLKKKIDDFTNSYKERNKSLVSMETESVVEILAVVSRHYKVEMEFLLAPAESYCEPMELEKFHNEISQECEKIFLTATNFRNPAWKRKYDKILQQQLQIDNMKFMRANDVKKSEIEGMLSNFVIKSREIYNREVKHRLSTLRQQSQQEASGVRILKSFSVIDEAARREALTTFDDNCKTITSPSLVTPAKSILVSILDERYRMNRTDLIKEEEDSEARKMQEDRKKLTQQSSTQSQQMVTTSKTNIVASFAIQPKTVLSNIRVAFHVGLHVTSVGFVDNGGQFQIIGHADNCLYFEGSSMVAFDEQEAKSLGTKTPIHQLLLKNKLNKMYSATTKGGKRSFRIEELISFILIHLKWRTERKIRRTISASITVIPQCLNGNQRLAVRQAAQLAGLRDNTLVNDTSAMAVAYAVNENLHDCQFVAANMFENFIDAASFTVHADRTVECEAVTGYFFIKHSRTFLQIVLDLVFGHSDYSHKILTKEVLQIPTQVPLVLAASEDQKNAVATAASQVATRTIKVDENYPLYGAAFLASIAGLDDSSAIYRKWAVNRDINGFNMFLERITRRDSRGYRNLINESNGTNLSDEDVQNIQATYFLNSFQGLHDETLRLLGLLDQLKDRLDSPSVKADASRVCQIRDQMETYNADILEAPNGTMERGIIMNAQEIVTGFISELHIV